jgi:hypothetical protein
MTWGTWWRCPSEKGALVQRGGDPATIKSVKRLQMKTPFALPADPIEAAQVVAKFWKAVELPQVGAEAACWRHRARLFQCQVGYVRYTTTAARVAWTIVCGEPLGADDHLRHDCGHLDCVRPDHLRRYDGAQLVAAAHALRQQGLTRATIARRLDVSWTWVARHLRRHGAGARRAA